MRVLPGWSSWATPPTSSPWWVATPEPRLWSSRPLSSQTLWWSPGAAAPACSYSSSFPAKATTTTKYESFQTLQTGTAIENRSIQINKQWIKLDYILKISKLNLIIGWKWPLTTRYLGTAKVSETETGLNCQHWAGVNLQSLARNGTFSLVQSSSTVVHLISSVLDFRVSMYTFQSLKLYITVVWDLQWVT